MTIQSPADVPKFENVLEAVEAYAMEPEILIEGEYATLRTSQLLSQAAEEIRRLRSVLRRRFMDASKCHMESRSHGLLCECFGPKSSIEKLAIEVSYYGYHDQARSNAAKEGRQSD